MGGISSANTAASVLQDTHTTPNGSAELAQVLLDEPQSEDDSEEFDEQTDDDNDEGPNINDALSFLNAVKARFTDTPDVYFEFLDVMKNFKNGLVGAQDLMDRIATLFHGHDDLLEQFSAFTPTGTTQIEPINASTDGSEAEAT